MKVMFLIVTDDKKSSCLFSTPELAVMWYYKDAIAAASPNKFKGRDGEWTSVEDEAAYMVNQHFPDYPLIDTIVVDDYNTEMMDR